MDEPTNGLDPTQIQQMRQLITNLSEEATVILSTHILQEVNAVCDRAIILRSGSLALDESLTSLKSSQSIKLRTSAEAGVQAALAGLEFIEKLENPSSGLWILTIKGDSEAAAPGIADAMISSGCPLIELAHESRDLETVFREINEQELNAVEER